MARQRPVSKSTAKNFPILFRLILQNVDDAAKIQRPDAEVAGEYRDVRTLLQLFCGRKYLQAIAGQKLPGKQGVDCCAKLCTARAEQRSHVIDAPAGWRNASGRTYVGILEGRCISFGEQITYRCLRRFAYKKHSEDRVMDDPACANLPVLSNVPVISTFEQTVSTRGNGGDEVVLLQGVQSRIEAAERCISVLQSLR
jgi:hypothetical protein